MMRMTDSNLPERPTHSGVRWAYRTVNAIFVSALVGTLVFWLIAESDGEAAASTAAWICGHILRYSLIVAAALSLWLLAHAIAARTLAFIKWPFVLCVLTVSLLSVNREWTDQLLQHDIVRLHMQNESGGSIVFIDVFGRAETLRVDSISSGSEVVARFRGRDLDRRTRDKPSNRIGVSWKAGGKWHERLLVDEDVVIGDSLIIIFAAPDSVRILPSSPAEGMK